MPHLDTIETYRGGVPDRPPGTQVDPEVTSVTSTTRRSVITDSAGHTHHVPTVRDIRDAYGDGPGWRIVYSVCGLMLDFRPLDELGVNTFDWIDQAAQERHERSE